MLVVDGFRRAYGNGGFADCAFLFPLLWPDNSAAPSSRTIGVLLSGTPDCNSARALVSGGNAVHTPSANIGGFVVGGSAASARRALDLQENV